jgi:hypothetical protein
MTGPSTPAELEIELVSRRALSKASSLLVVRAGERYLLLGSTPQSVQLITELGPSLLEGPSGEVAATERALAASAGGLSSPGLSLPGVTNVERAGAHVAPGFAAQPDLPRGAPWTALQDDQGSTTAWDAFLASLRERTVRR